MSSPAPPSPASPSRRLRIAVVTETWPPEINGVANTMRQLVRGLGRRGHRVTLIRPHQAGEPWPDRASPGAAPQTSAAAPAAEVLVHGLPIPGYRGLRFGLPAVGRLRHCWRTDRPDVVYVATQGPLGHAALHVARRLAIPVVAGFHTQFHQYSRHYGLGLLMRPIVEVLRAFHNQADVTLVPTADLQRELDAEGFVNLAVFSRGVDTVLFNPARRSPSLRARWGVSAEDLVALYVGRIAPEKNIGLALAAFSALTARYPTLRAVLVGDGPELPRLRREHPGFIFTGAKVGEELATHYASADLFLFPSLTETFGNVVTEAMASALAVVAFDYAAAREHIRPWQNGVTVPVGEGAALIEAALALCADPDRLRALGRAARERAAALDWERVICGVEQRLFDVIERHGRADHRHETMAATTD